jgi:hypothetical protein
LFKLLLCRRTYGRNKVETERRDGEKGKDGQYDVKDSFCCPRPPLADTLEVIYILERWPDTTSAWAGWKGFDISVNRYGGVHSLL